MTQYGIVSERWDAKTLSSLSRTGFKIDFPYRQLRAGFAGITAGVGASAQIAVPAEGGALRFSGRGSPLALIIVNGDELNLSSSYCKSALSRSSLEEYRIQRLGISSHPRLAEDAGGFSARPDDTHFVDRELTREILSMAIIDRAYSAHGSSTVTQAVASHA